MNDTDTRWAYALVDAQNLMVQLTRLTRGSLNVRPTEIIGLCVGIKSNLNVIEEHFWQENLRKEREHLRVIK